MQNLRDQSLHCLAGGSVGCFVQWSPVPRVPDVPGVPLGSRSQQEWGFYWCGSVRAGAGDQVPSHQPSQGGGHLGAALVLHTVLQVALAQQCSGQDRAVRSWSPALLGQGMTSLVTDMGSWNVGWQEEPWSDCEL